MANRRKAVDRAEGEANLIALDLRIQLVDTWRRVIHFEARAHRLASEGVVGGTRRRIGSDDANGVAAVGEEIGFEIHEAFVNLHSQQLPTGFVIAAVVDVVRQCVIVVVMGLPLHGDGMFVLNSRKRQFVAGGSCVLRLAVSAGRDTGPDHDGHILDFRRHIFRQIVNDDAVDHRHGAARLQHRFPLDKPRRRSIDRQVLLQIDFLPRTPVAVGIVDVTATRQQREVAVAADLGPSPAGEVLGIEDIALVSALVHCIGAEEKDLAQIAGGSVEAAVRRGSERRYLVSASLNQVGVLVATQDDVNPSAISASRQ